MAPRDESFADCLSRVNEITLKVTGRNSGKLIALPVWFVWDNQTLYLLPVHGSETQWYKNVLKNPSIRIEIGDSETKFTVFPLTSASEVSPVIEKFRGKYGASGMKYYSKLDVAVIVKTL
jgi:deazaflavin-dependent oxidoreductase (nitroreductase family)